MITLFKIWIKTIRINSLNKDIQILRNAGIKTSELENLVLLIENERVKLLKIKHRI